MLDSFDNDYAPSLHWLSIDLVLGGMLMKLLLQAAFISNYCKTVIAVFKIYAKYIQFHIIRTM